MPTEPSEAAKLGHTPGPTADRVGGGGGVAGHTPGPTVDRVGGGGWQVTHQIPLSTDGAGGRVGGQASASTERLKTQKQGKYVTRAKGDAEHLALARSIYQTPCPVQSSAGLDLSFAGSQGEYHCMWRCPRPGLNPSGLVNNSSLAAGPQFTEMKIL